MKNQKTENPRETKQYQEFVAEILDELVNRNIVDHILKLNEMENARQRYFYLISPVWKAIRDHISRSKECGLIKRDERLIRSYRGLGASVQLKNVHLPKIDNPKNILDFEIEVEYIQEGEEGAERPATYKKKYWINVPSELELDFTQRKFENWVKKEKAKMDAEIKKSDLEKIKQLKKKYPKIDFTKI